MWLKTKVKYTVKTDLQLISTLELLDTDFNVMVISIIKKSDGHLEMSSRELKILELKNTVMEDKRVQQWVSQQDSWEK